MKIQTSFESSPINLPSYYCCGPPSVLILLDKDSIHLSVDSSECGCFGAMWEDHFTPSTMSCPHATLINWSPLYVAHGSIVTCQWGGNCNKPTPRRGPTTPELGHYRLDDFNIPDAPVYDAKYPRAQLLIPPDLDCDNIYQVNMI